MPTLICKKCRNIQTGYLDHKDIKCTRCGSKDLNLKSREIKLYWKCNSCEKIFKISETTAKQLIAFHQNPTCPYCEKTHTHTHTTLKRNYKKFSGQTQKIHTTKFLPLSNFIGE